MLFISHDLSSIEKLCDRVALMQRGQLIASGAPHEIVTEYQRMVTSVDVAVTADVPVTLTLSPAARIERISFRDLSGSEVLSANTGGPLVARVEYDAARAVPDAIVEVFYYSRDGRILHCQHSTALNGGGLELPAGQGALEFVTDEIGLQPGTYSVGATIREPGRADTMDWSYGRTVLYVEPGKSVRGYFYGPHQWRLVDSHGHADGHRPNV
jgi:hypothetical protein